MDTLQNKCVTAFLTPSDINEHIPTLYFLANQCNSVTEFGVRTGVSSSAFLFSKAKLRSYDIELTSTAIELFNLAKSLGKDAELIQQDSLLITNFEHTDMLFIDTLHTYAQLRQELELYHLYVNECIVLHDTEMFGDIGEDRGPGLNQAINEFLEAHNEWIRAMVYDNNNGLTILVRRAI